jgi:hypothetical protein
VDVKKNTKLIRKKKTSQNKVKDFQQYIVYAAPLVHNQFACHFQAWLVAGTHKKNRLPLVLKYLQDIFVQNVMYLLF